MEGTDKIKQQVEVKKFLLRYLLPYIGVMLVVCLLADWLMREYAIFRTPMHGAAKIHRSITRISPEIPILGSSRALGSYIPDSISDRSYNYGINGVGFDVIDLFLSIELERKHAETPIIINFDYDFWKSTLGDVNNYIPHVSHPGVRKLMKDQDYYQIWYDLPAIRFFNNYDSYVKDYINFRVNLTKVTSLGASLEKNTLSPSTFDKLVQKRLKNPQRWSVHPEKEKRLFQHFNARPDRMFYLIVAPYHRSYLDVFENMAMAQAWLAKADAFPNVRVIQVDGHSYPDSLFTNTTHINLAGARRFSGTVRRAIFGEQKGRFPIRIEFPGGYGPPLEKEN